ncbi:DUF6415 family natural product biosynthesis protein [Streptomyces sp. NPDC018352]|uniref:DUF6415 family natural product biosynthesis protein n=1 Tax=Streptomyces sp. NPDC018352 TaxID=3157194 RepID=UPI0033C5B9E5
MSQADQPFAPDRLRWMLSKVQKWQPYVDGVLLDDVAFVLDNYMPSEEEVEVLATRLSGHLLRLVQAVTSKVDRWDQKASDLVKRALATGSVALTGDHSQDVGHLRRMAWTLEAFLERLVENQCLKETPQSECAPPGRTEERALA